MQTVSSAHNGTASPHRPQATTCRVSLSRDDAGAVLVVDDDGVGFDADAASTGMGLANVRGRVEPLGGALEIESAAGSGTTVRVRIPR